MLLFFFLLAFSFIVCRRWKQDKLAQLIVRVLFFFCALAMCGRFGGGDVESYRIAAFIECHRLAAISHQASSIYCLYSWCGFINIFLILSTKETQTHNYIRYVIILRWKNCFIKIFFSIFVLLTLGMKVFTYMQIIFLEKKYIKFQYETILLV